MSIFSKLKSHLGGLNTALLTLFAGLAAISGYLVFFLPPAKSIKSIPPVAIEFHRIRAASSTPYLFKAMEGATLTPYPAFGPDTYTLIDGSGDSFGVLTDEFSGILNSFPFVNFTPASTNIWRDFSGSHHARDFAELGNSRVFIDDGSIDEMSTARRIICATEYSEMNEDGSGWFSDEDSISITGVEKHLLCDPISYSPYSFFFTAVTLENVSGNLVQDLWLDLVEYDFEFEVEMYYALMAQDGQEILSRVISENFASPSSSARRLGVSNLQPGRKIFILLNAYQPDALGLPQAFLLSRTEISEITYSLGGQTFVITAPAPLAESRLGLITTPNGGVGGQ